MNETYTVYNNFDFKRFRCESFPNKTFDLIPYASKFIADHPYADIYVGTDSQDISSSRRAAKKTVYATVVAFRIGTKGVHVIYLIQKIPLIRDRWTRLWGEIERTREVVDYIERNSSLKIHQVDIDYNQDDRWYSNKLVAAGTGLFTGLGYKVGSKPDELVATRAADHLVRN